MLDGHKNWKVPQYRKVKEERHITVQEGGNFHYFISRKSIFSFSERNARERAFLSDGRSLWIQAEWRAG